MGRSRWLGASLAAAAAFAALIPSAGLAISALGDGRIGPERPALFTPASVDPQLARFVAERGGISRLKRFTPAGVDARASRTVTVAVRVDAEQARAIQVRSAIQAAQDGAGDAPSGVRIASTRYNLGLSRGYQNFAQSTVQATPQGTGQSAVRSAILSKPLSDAAIPNLAEFRPSRGTAREETRFAARIADGTSPGAAASVAARRAGSVDEQALDIAGSYRLTRNLDVTAGVRYSLERDRAVPLQKSEEKDNQAVYIGTQFRF